MKKSFAVLLIAAALFLLPACENNDSYKKGYLAGYEDGYNLGYDESVEDTLEYVSDALYDELREIAGNTAREYGLHPDEAVIVLDDFVNGKSVSEEELQIAIESMCGYYYNSFDLPDAIEDMKLYIGYDESAEDTIEYIADAMYDILWDLERNTAKKYGLHPDEAAVVLDDFMSGVPVSDEELQIAIDSICAYYYDSFEIPKEIEGLDLYID